MDPNIVERNHIAKIINACSCVSRYVKERGYSAALASVKIKTLSALFCLRVSSSGNMLNHKKATFKIHAVYSD